MALVLGAGRAPSGLAETMARPQVQRHHARRGPQRDGPRRGSAACDPVGRWSCPTPLRSQVDMHTFRRELLYTASIATVDIHRELISKVYTLDGQHRSARTVFTPLHTRDPARPPRSPRRPPRTSSRARSWPRRITSSRPVRRLMTVRLLIGHTTHHIKSAKLAAGDNFFKTGAG